MERKLAGAILGVSSMLLVGCSGSGPDTSDGGDGGQTQRLSAYECITSKHCGRIMVAAHRGAHKDYPENSLAAIRAAAEIGADFAEMDVRDTADGKLVLMHDSSVDRTTDGVGEVKDMTWQQIQELNLEGGDTNDPQSSKVPLFSDALALAKQLNIMLYVDQKTDRWDLVLAAIQAGDYHHTALVRDSIDSVAQMKEADSELLVMPPCDDMAQLADFKQRMDDLLIVEISGAPDPQLVESFHQALVLVQEDVLAMGDSKALVGDYTGWKDYVEAGVDLIQTEYPDLFLPALHQWEQTGIFPDKGPAAM